MKEDTTNGWVEYKKLVIAELERLNICVSGVIEDVTELRIEIKESAAHLRLETERAAGTIREQAAKEIATTNKNLAILQVKAGAWGALAGAVPAIIMLITWLVNR